MATSSRKKPFSIETEHQIAADIEKQRESLLNEMMLTGDELSPALQVLYSEMGLSEETVAEVFVYKAIDNSKSWPGVWKGSPDDYDLEAIAKVHGSGEYKVCVYITANGHKTKRGEKVFAWLLSAADEKARLAPPQQAQSEAVTKNDIAIAVAEAMRPILAALQPQVPVMNPMQMFEMSLGMAKMMQPTQQNNNPIETMRMLLEIQNSMKKESEPETKETGATTSDLMLALIDKFGAPFAQIMMSGQAQQAAAGTQVQHLQETQGIGYNPGELQQNPINEGNPGDMLVQQQLKMGIGFLIEQAASGNPFETYAEVAIDAVPEEALDEILKNPDPVAWLATFDARVNDHKEWFKNMLDEIKKILSSSDEPSA